MTELTSRASVRALQAGDWPAVRGIYESGIASGLATFETEAPPWESWDRSHLAAPRLVAVLDAAVVGWAALSRVSDRCVYGGVAEVSVYVDPSHHRQGVGRLLLGRLVAESESAGLWTLQAGIFAANTASLGLFARCGFRVVGRRERLGRLGGEWRDVMLLERRSSIVGVEAAQRPGDQPSSDSASSTQ